MTAPVLVQERRGSILVARLNRPEARNALTPRLMQDLGAAVVEAESDAGVRAVVLTGSGDRAFCAGMDLRAFAAGESMDLDDNELTRGFYRLLEGRVAVPVIGAANGAAVGGGFELLLGCDVIVASTEASFGLPEVRRGLFPGGGGTLLGRRIPLSVALEMTLTGYSITAHRAYELGLVNAVVPPEQVVEAAIGMAERIAANGPLAVAAVKELVRLGASGAAGMPERLSHWQSVVYGSEDAKEGARSFIEKRAPLWQGR